MKFEAVVAILNGDPDQQGDVLTDNVTIPHNPVKVTLDFHGPTIGVAHVRVDGNRILAEIDIDPSQFPPELVERFKGVIGGSVKKRTKGKVEDWVLKEISLTDTPVDKNLPNLRRKV